MELVSDDSKLEAQAVVDFIDADSSGKRCQLPNSTMRLVCFGWWQRDSLWSCDAELTQFAEHPGRLKSCFHAVWFAVKSGMVSRDKVLYRPLTVSTPLTLR